MSDLQAAVEDYLTIRRSVGFTLDRAGKLLPDFVAYLDAAGAQTVTVAAAAEWAMKPTAATPAWWGATVGDRARLRPIPQCDRRVAPDPAD